MIVTIVLGIAGHRPKRSAQVVPNSEIVQRQPEGQMPDSCVHFNNSFHVVGVMLTGRLVVVILLVHCNYYELIQAI